MSSEQTDTLGPPLPDRRVAPEEGAIIADPTAPVYRTYRRRYMGLIAIVLLNLATGFVWLTFTAAITVSKNYFHSSTFTVTMTSVVYFIAYIIMAPVSGWMFETKGIQASLSLGGMLQTVGCLLRLFAFYIPSTPDNPTGRIVLTLFGQAIAASAQPFFLNVAPKYAAVWFAENERTTATMLGTIPNPLAAALAELIIPHITPEPNSMAFTLSISLALSILAQCPVAWMSETPPLPPSPSAAEFSRQATPEPFWLSLKKVFLNGQFRLLLLAFATFVGCFNTLATLIVEFSTPYGYTATEAGYFGAAIILAGLVGAVISGPVTDRFKIYKLLCKTFVPMAAIMYLCLVFVIRRDALYKIMGVCIVLGFASFAALPPALELAVEITYPVTPASSTSILWAAGQALAIVFATIAQTLHTLNSSKSKELNSPLIFLTGCCFVFGVVPTLLIRSPYWRMEAEKEARRGHGQPKKQQEEVKESEEESREEEPPQLRVPIMQMHEPSAPASDAGVHTCEGGGKEEVDKQLY
ncbi:hypothetical protein EC968_007323 [Mortierella alpina]|nr:hypothetical protein EC968_007323 [Mortierella alpina]